MLSDNIKRLRIAAGLSQEQLAVELAVVRQTVSKWERGLSVPDADMVIRLAEILHVSVGELLGADAAVPLDLAAQLERADALLAEKSAQERRSALIARRRGAITALCMLALIMALVTENALLSLAVTALCFAAAAITLWHSLPLLTPGAGVHGMRAVKLTTAVDALFFAAAIALALTSAAGVFTPGAYGEKWLAAIIVAAVMTFSGIVAPRLPFNRHTGLRLPWTVSDERAWNVAHRTIGFAAVPTALLYLAAVAALDDFEAVTLAAVLIWLGAPALLSLVSCMGHSDK